jgi:hypothetical protein
MTNRIEILRMVKCPELSEFEPCDLIPITACIECKRMVFIANDHVNCNSDDIS